MDKITEGIKAIRIVSNIEMLINNKYMLMIEEKYHVAMLDNLWKMYKTKREKRLFCQNLLFYCDIKNAHHGVAVKRQQPLLISLKNEKNDVVPKFIFNRRKQLKVL